MIKNTLITFFVLGLSFSKSFAQSVKTPTNFTDLTCLFINLILDFVPFIVVLAVAAFLFGLIKYIAHADNEEQRSAGSKMMFYGIIGFVFMLSVWGIVKILVSSFGVDFGVPQFKSSDNGSGFFGSCRGYF